MVKKDKDEKDEKDKKKTVRELEDLPGVGPAIAEKLKEANYDMQRIAAGSPHELAEITELNTTATKKIIAAARDGIESSFESAVDVRERRKNIGRISTGSKNLDDLLGGGVETMAISEFYGKFGSGKTQVGFQLAVNVQQPMGQGGLDGGTLIIDTESTFRPERIVQLAEHKGMDPQKVLENIHVAKAINSDHQIVLADKAEELIIDNNVKLVVVDSLTAHFRADYLGRGSLGERQQKLNKHIHSLQRLADKFNIAIFVTNQVMDNPGILFGDPTTPIGGHVLGHASTYRVYLRRGKENKRVARLVDSPCLPDSECVFRVSEEGVGD